MKKRLTAVYYILTALLLLIALISSFQSFNVEIRTWHAGDGLNELEYSSMEQVSEDVDRYYINYVDVGDAGNCLLFYSSHQFCKVYADDQLIYAVEPKNSLLGHTSGTRWNFVSVPRGAKKLCVEFTAAYESARNTKHQFYMGNGAEMYRYLMRDSLVAMIMNILTAIIGVALILFWVVMRKKSQLGHAAVYFGTFVLLMGAWSFGETDGCILILDNPVVISFMAFVYLMLMTVPFVLFIRETLGLKDRFLCWAICLYSLGESLFCLVLLFTGVRDLKETAILTHISMGLAVLYMIYGWIYGLRYGERGKKLRVNLLGIIIMGASLMVDLGAYYMGAMYVDSVGRFGFLLYIVIFTMDVVADSMEKIEAGRKAAYYKELASVDRLTGLYNRNAFIEDMSAQAASDDISLVTFDLNDLKYTNDAFGHATGDKYIVDAAEMIERVFAPFGKCYRIGGDEFCAVILKSRRCSLDELVEKLRIRQTEYNKYSEEISMHIACGYAEYDAGKDGSLEDTRNRADVRMYEDKARIKGKKDK